MDPSCTLRALHRLMCMARTPVCNILHRRLFVYKILHQNSIFSCNFNVCFWKQQLKIIGYIYDTIATFLHLILNTYAIAKNGCLVFTGMTSLAGTLSALFAFPASWVVEPDFWTLVELPLSVIASPCAPQLFFYFICAATLDVAHHATRCTASTKPVWCKSNSHPMAISICLQKVLSWITSILANSLIMNQIHIFFTYLQARYCLNQTPSN